MSILQNIEGFELNKSKNALEMLLMDRKNEFRELADSLLHMAPASGGSIKNWEGFVLNFCFDVTEAFKTWMGESITPDFSFKGYNHSVITIT